jgi:MerR family transcriptional regulator, light-induced transcriptional regulator
MATYSIKELALLTGIKAHTIRIWEKRYNMFSPARTDTNIRRYSDSDLKLALNTSLLQNMGYKISRIAKLSSDEINSIISKGNQYTTPPAIPESLFAAAINLDKTTFSNKLNDTIAEKGIEWTYENLIIPFQSRMGMLWQAGTISPAQEHFSSNIIREILITNSFKNIDETSPLAEKIIFYLPEGEFHEIGLLYYRLLAIREGLQVIYLGQSVPIDDVLSVAKEQRIKLIFTSYTVLVDDQDLLNQLNRISTELPKSKIMATGSLIKFKSNIIPTFVHKISSALQFRNTLKKFVQ